MFILLEIAQDMHVYRLNDKKALLWLQKKVYQLVPKFDSIKLLKSSITEDLSKVSTEQEKKGKYDNKSEYAVFSFFGRGHQRLSRLMGIQI